VDRLEAAVSRPRITLDTERLYSVGLFHIGGATPGGYDPQLVTSSITAAERQWLKAHHMAIGPARSGFDIIKRADIYVADLEWRLL
jgi:hypothetical protein